MVEIQSFVEPTSVEHFILGFSMFDNPFVALIFIGLAIKSVGFLVRDELVLRSLVFTGILFDIAFYALQTPIFWGSIFANSVLVLINLALVIVISLERSSLFMSKADRIVFQQFKTLSPGQFRKVNGWAKWHTAKQDTVLLKEGYRADQLFLINTESFWVTKHGQCYKARGPAFAGEIMLLQGGVASATVTVPEGARYGEWSSKRLRRAMRRNRSLENALVARFGHDLADKVRNSVPVPGAVDSSARHPVLADRPSVCVLAESRSEERAGFAVVGKATGPA